ncbi:SDR family NAD(P)-dependent oxidoreductase [Streptomyces sp. ODS28]|uniref:SDR family NAD(P)-dependent oxidoreductase n=1 Tax=Streptomyces sp. ODS28 TaxID=3136688 RepID=UPI0031EF334B
MSVKLNGTTVAVTGGSRGIGLAVAAAFRAQGARVAIGARGVAEARAAAGRIGASAHPLDVTEPDSVRRFAEAVEAEFGEIDVWVNNAGEMLVGRFEEETDRATRHQLDVNLLGTVNGMKAVLPAMRARGDGHIINIVSAVGMVGLPGCATYSAAKHAVTGLCEGLRGELRGSGVHLSLIMPIPAATGLTSGVGKGRFVPLLAPEAIAARVVATARHPRRYLVYVPGWTNALTRSLSLLPQSWRDAMGRFLKADQLLRTTDGAARRGYEQHALYPAHMPAPGARGQAADTAHADPATHTANADGTDRSDRGALA